VRPPVPEPLSVPSARPSDYFDDAEQENHTRERGLPAGDLTAYIRAMWAKPRSTGSIGVFSGVST
jgi:hypothetical protein